MKPNDLFINFICDYIICNVNSFHRKLINNFLFVISISIIHIPEKKYTLTSCKSKYNKANLRSEEQEEKC